MLLRKCEKCGYTMQATCRCGGRTALAHPPKFSLTDRHAKYRRLARTKKPAA